MQPKEFPVPERVAAYNYYHLLLQMDLLRAFPAAWVGRRILCKPHVRLDRAWRIRVNSSYELPKTGPQRLETTLGLVPNTLLQLLRPVRVLQTYCALLCKLVPTWSRPCHLASPSHTYPSDHTEFTKPLSRWGPTVLHFVALPTSITLELLCDTSMPLLLHLHQFRKLHLRQDQLGAAQRRSCLLLPPRLLACAAQQASTGGPQRGGAMPMAA